RHQRCHHHHRPGAQHRAELHRLRLGQSQRDADLVRDRGLPGRGPQRRLRPAVRLRRQPVGVHRGRLGHPQRRDHPGQVVRRPGAALSTNRLTTTWSLDQRGLPKATTDPNGNTTTYTYDEAGRLTTTVAPTVNTETGGGTAAPTHPVSMVGYDTFGAKAETSD